MKADPSVQLRLLDLQQLDTRLQQLAHARTRIPQQAELKLSLIHISEPTRRS